MAAVHMIALLEILRRRLHGHNIRGAQHHELGPLLAAHRGGEGGRSDVAAERRQLHGWRTSFSP